MRASAESITRLGSDATLAEIQAEAIGASRKICSEYVAWKAAEDHRRSCELMAQWTNEGDEAREAVRQALEKLPVGCARAKLEAARDAALAPFRAARTAAAEADFHLHRISSYIEELGNEESGEWDLGNWFERQKLTEKLKSKLRQPLVQKFLERKLSPDDVNNFIELWVDRELELEE